MKGTKRKTSLHPPQRRRFSLHARFTPDGPDLADDLAFVTFWSAAMDRIHKLKGRQLAQRRRRVASLLAARRKTDRIVIKALRNEIPVELAARKVQQLVPDRELLRELLEVWDKGTRATAEQVAKAKEDIVRHERELAHSERLLQARKGINAGLATLAEAAQAGDAFS